MKWSFGIKQKTRIALILGITFLLIFLKNVLDRSQVRQLGSSFSSVYEDRLVVEGYIFTIADLLHHKKNKAEACMTSMLQEGSGIPEETSRINQLMVDYGKTKLTHPESIIFNKLKQCLIRINYLEQDYYRMKEHSAQAQELRIALQKAFSEASEQLHLLSAIQLSEAKNLNDQSRKIISGSALLSELEFALFIIIGLVIQILLFATGRNRTPFPVHPGLN